MRHVSRPRVAAWAAGVGLLVATPAAAQSLIVTGGPGLAPPPVEYRGSNAVHVHIEGDGTLFQESTNGWQPVCQVPCTTLVNPTGNYKLGGFMEKDSALFQFPSGKPLELIAHTESSLDIQRSVWGWMILGLAPVPVVSGALIFAGTFESNGQPTAVDHIGGGALMAAGAALLVFGIYTLVDAPNTTLTTTDGRRIARMPSLRLSGELSLTPTGVVF